MRFNSIEFLVFFPAVSIAFFLIPQRSRWFFLLAASYIFYMSWKPKYILVLLVMTAIGYLAGLWLNREQIPGRRRLILILSLAASLGILFFFKYFNSSNPIVQRVLEQMGFPGWVSQYINLPLGISFFSLLIVSYIVDVYRGTAQVEKHPGIYALFVAFFPYLLAGPIGRANHLLPQFYETHTPDYENIVSGLQRMVWGLFKKLVIADRLAVVVNTVYGDPTSYTGWALIIATYAFAFQIYCDFSGYADIAIGAARVLGFHLTENFQQPYYAQSIQEFWRRWHISLSNWLRDYIFYPLQRILVRRGSSTDFLAIVAPILVTMLVSGLWHGESWNFLVWGVLQGIFMVIAVLWSRSNKSTRWSFALPPRVAAGLRIFGTFNLVCFTWIFFRANTLSDAIYIIGHLFVNLGSRTSLIDLLPGGAYDWMIAISAILLMEAVQIIQMRRGGLRQVMRLQPLWLRWSIYFGLVLVIFILGKFEATQFIYSVF